MDADKLGSDSQLVFNQSITVMINPGVEFAATVVACHRLFDRLHAMDHGKAVRANISMVALHPATFEREGMVWLLACDSQVGTGGFPFHAVGFYPATATPFVGDEMGKLMLQSAPEFFGFAVLQLWIQLNETVRPPGTSGGGLHPWIPRYADLAGEFMEGEGFRGLDAPCC